MKIQSLQECGCARRATKLTSRELVLFNDVRDASRSLRSSQPVSTLSNICTPRGRVIHHVCHVRARLPAWQLMTHLSLVFLTTAGAGERSQCSARLPWLEIGAMPQRLMAA